MAGPSSNYEKEILQAIQESIARQSQYIPVEQAMEEAAPQYNLAPGAYDARNSIRVPSGPINVGDNK